MPNAEYDAIAAEYQHSKELPFRIYAEAPLLFSLVGDVRGKDVLDLGCGEGIYSRKLKRLGARTVVGVDLSSEMIKLAEAREQAEPLGVKYLVGDVAAVGAVGSFDLVVGSYLLNYARSADQLTAFCRTVRANMKPGGRFVGMNDNPANDPAHYQGYRKYGFVKSTPLPRKEGDAITYTIFAEDGSSFHFDNFYLAPSTYDHVLKSIFTNYCWRAPDVTPAGIEAEGADYWREFKADPPVVGIEAW